MTEESVTDRLCCTEPPLGSESADEKWWNGACACGLQVMYCRRYCDLNECDWLVY